MSAMLLPLVVWMDVVPMRAPAEAPEPRRMGENVVGGAMDGAKKTARDAVAPRPPWSDRWIVDANVSPPVTKEIRGESQTKLNGDVTTGYKGDRFGFRAHGESTYYSIDEDRTFSLTERYAGSFDVWGVIDLHPSVRLEPSFAGGAVYYGTLADDATSPVMMRQTNQDSIFARAVGALGVRVQPGSRLAVHASFGAGYQYEDYFRVAQTSNGEQAMAFNAASTVRYEARLSAYATVLPSIVSVRARGDVNSFSMHRSDLAVSFTPGRARSDEAVTEIAQTEIFARGFVDLDAARFFGFVPAIHGGANVFVIASGGSSTSAVTPVFGLGIRREAL